MNAEKPSLYLETSVVSYYRAKPSRDVIALARQETTRKWWDNHLSEYDVLISDIVLKEAAQGDAAAAHSRIEALREFKTLSMTDEIERVASIYLERGLIPEVKPGDALHLAFASINGILYLATWNFAHLANAHVRHQLREVNSSEDLSIPIICTPEELLGE